MDKIKELLLNKIKEDILAISGDIIASYGFTTEVLEIDDVVAYQVICEYGGHTLNLDAYEIEDLIDELNVLETKCEANNKVLLDVLYSKQKKVAEDYQPIMDILNYHFYLDLSHDYVDINNLIDELNQSENLLSTVKHLIDTDRDFKAYIY